MEKDIICTVCPSGCVIRVVGDEKEIKEISGFTCNRGKEYASDEFISPKRILTSTARVENSSECLVAVRSRTPLPKEKIFECMDEIRKLNLKAPIKRGDVLIENILGTGVDIISSGEAL